MKGKKFLATALSLVMTVSSMQLALFKDTVFAADPIGCIDSTDYYSLKDLAKALKGHKNGNITIKMYRSWNAAGSDDYDTCLEIPSGCTATFEMNGYIFNRNRAFRNDSTSDGELFILRSDSSLTVNGGTGSDKDRSYDLVATYNSTSRSGKASRSITTYGGTLTGGCSSDGGGCFTVHDDCVLILNDVTIAGCCSKGSVTSGFGGAIYIEEDGSTVRLNNTLITGCFADQDGGAIYANDDHTTIQLSNSVLDRNYAHEQGGAIYTDDPQTIVTGVSGSKIINNQSGEQGGAIFVDYDETTVSGFEISGNRSGSHGGGIYSGEEKAVFSNLVITNNHADKNGGGIYVENDNTEISGCTVKGNYAGDSGGGVYVDSDVDVGFAVTGRTVIRDNKAKYYGNQLHIHQSSNTHINFKLTKGSDVWMSYEDLGSKNSVMVTETSGTVKTPNCIQYLHPSNHGWHFTYRSAPDYRKIYYVRDGKDSDSTGKPYDPVQDPVDIKPQDAGSTIVGKVGAGGGTGTEYNLIRGYSRHEETDSDTNDSSVVFYYSDAFFDQSPETYNDHLATASLNLAYAGMYLRAKEPVDANGNYYYNRHAAAKQFLADIGCPDQNIYVNDSNFKKPETDSIGVTIASKNLAYADGTETGYILVPVVVRGGGYELEWASNGTLGSTEDTKNRGYEAEGFSKAADDVIKAIDDYIVKYGLGKAVEEGKVKFWVTGYSRAGATANITSKRLVEKYADGSDGRKNQVFAYTCEAPMGGTDNAEKLSDKTKYYCIHNLINAVDIVPLVAPQLMGFKRYGVDHYIPGTAASTVKTIVVDTSLRSSGGPAAATVYYDNDIVLAKSISSNIKTKMLAMLRAVDSGIIFDDYFHPMEMDLFPEVSIYEEGDYADNHVEFFIRDFMRFLQEGYDSGFNETGLTNKINPDTQAVPDRDYYVKNLQPALRDLFAMVFTMDNETSEAFIGRASSIMNYIPTAKVGGLSKLEIYNTVIEKWDGYRGHLDKKDYETKFWDKFVATGALEVLSESDASKLKQHWSVLLNMALTLVSADYHYIPGEENHLGGTWAKGSSMYVIPDTLMLTGTFATYATYILQNHYPEVNLAWARTYDSYYSADTDEVEILCGSRASAAGYKVDKPEAYGKEQDGTEAVDKVLEEGADKTNSLSGDQKIILEDPDIVGEAIYYDLKDNTNSAVTEKNKLYRGGIALSLGTGESKSYTITAYTISYGVRSDKAVYNINLLNDRFKVTVADGSSSDPVSYMYKVGDEVTVVADPVSDKYFVRWSVKLIDTLNDLVYSDDIAAKLMGDSASSVKAKFTMPEPGSDGYPRRYALEITAVLADSISSLTASPDAPEAGHPLAEEVEVTFDNGKKGTYPVIWTYEYEPGDSADGNRSLPSAEPADDPAVPGGETLGDIPASGDENVQGDAAEPAADEDIAEPKDAPAPEKTGSNPGSGSKNAGTKTVPASGNAYNDTVYTATVTVPEDRAGGIVFESSLTGSSGTGTVKRVTRNADGSATLVIEFDRTAESGGTEPPEAVIKLTVKAIDINTMEYDDSASVELHVRQGEEITLTAPEAENEVFLAWDLKETGITLTGDSKVSEKTVTMKIPDPLSSADLEIDVICVPVVNKLTCIIDAPQGGEVLQTVPDADTLKVTISNEYEIRPDCVKIEWTPAPVVETGAADYLTAYTVAVSIVTQPDEQGRFYVYAKKKSDTGYSKVNAVFFYDLDLEAAVNGEPAVCDQENNSVNFTFPITKYSVVSVERPGNMTGVAHGTGKSSLEELLPDTLKLLISNGSEIDAGVTWTLTAGGYDDPREEITWTAVASVTLPDTVQDDNGVLSDPVVVTITVDGADHAQSPMTTLDPGTYLSNQETALVTMEEGGTTYYAVGSNGSFTTFAEGETISVSREDPRTEDGKFIIRAYTSKNGEWDSPVATYVYTFSNEIPIPVSKELHYNGSEQVGILSSKFYTVEEVRMLEGTNNGRVNEDGEAVATDVGVYEVTLKINDGFVWQKTDEETTAEDQVVTFSIFPSPMVTFDPGEGTGKMDPVLVPDGGYILPGSSFAAPEGKVFIGWSVDDETEVLTEGTEIAVSKDVTLTARYGSGSHLAGYTLSLDGDIAVNYHMELTPDVLEHKDTAYMEFTVYGKAPVKVYVKDAEEAEIGGKTYYVFKCSTSAKDMTMPISAQLVDGEDRGITYRYTVKEYAEHIISHGDEDQYRNAVPLVKAMLGYGAASQVYFSVWGSGLADEILSDEEKDLSNITIPEPESPVISITADGVTFEGASLSLKTETTLSFYFKGLPSDTIFRCQGKKVETVSGSGYTIARIRGISSRELGDRFTVTFDGGSVEYSLMTYCYRILNGASDDENHKNVCRALYKYYLEAADYYKD